MGTFGAVGGALTGGTQHLKDYRKASQHWRNVEKAVKSGNLTNLAYKGEANVLNRLAFLYKPSLMTPKFLRRVLTGSAVGTIGGLGSGYAADLVRARLRKKSNTK